MARCWGNERSVHCGGPMARFDRRDSDDVPIEKPRELLASSYFGCASVQRLLYLPRTGVSRETGERT